MNPDEYLIAVKNRLEKEIGEEIQHVDFEHGFTLYRVTTYQKEGIPHIVLNFEVKLK